MAPRRAARKWGRGGGSSCRGSRSLPRSILGIAAGFVVFWLVAFAVGAAMRAAWPAYAEAAPSMSFDLPMKIARLALGAGGTLAAAVTAALVSGRARYAPLALGLVLLAAFVPIHIGLWESFPVWYHLTFLSSLVVVSLLGG
jgi:hypothetical protein